MQLYNHTTIEYEKIYGIGKPDQVLKEVSHQTWELPLSLLEDNSSFVLETQTGERDTLTISYKREPKFESNICGIRMFLGDVTIGTPTTLPGISISQRLSFLFANEEGYEAFIND